QRTNLPHCGSHIAGVGVGHALYGNRRITADRNIAHHNLAGMAPFDWRLVFHRIRPVKISILGVQRSRENSARLFTTRTSPRSTGSPSKVIAPTASTAPITSLSGAAPVTASR